MLGPGLVKIDPPARTERDLLDLGPGRAQDIGRSPHGCLDLGMPDPVAEIETEAKPQALEIEIGLLAEIQGWFQRLDVTLIRSLCHLQEQAGIGDAAGQRTEMRKLIELTGQDGEGDATKTRLVADHTAKTGGNAHRAAHIRPLRQRYAAGGDGDAGTAR